VAFGWMQRKLAMRSNDIPDRNDWRQRATFIRQSNLFEKEHEKIKAQNNEFSEKDFHSDKHYCTFITVCKC
jgi:hypothetical protein